MLQMDPNFYSTSHASTSRKEIIHFKNLTLVMKFLHLTDLFHINFFHTETSPHKSLSQDFYQYC